MVEYGTWKESLSLGGEEYGADLIADSYAIRANLKKIFAVNGLPSVYVDNLVRASQVSDVPHTWRVKECKSESEVTAEILEAGRRALDADRKERNSHIITYVGVANGTAEYEFLAAGAIRDKLTKTYHNEEFPVVSRAVVAPKHRGKGLGSLIVEHRMKSSLRFFKKRPKAIHFATDSKKIVHSFKRTEKDVGLNFVYIGDERYEASDGMHTVHDYLCFVPWYKEELLKACDVLGSAASGASADFKNKLESFMEEGAKSLYLSSLEKLYQPIRAAAEQRSEAKSAIALIDEMFFAMHTIGAEDPIVAS